MNTRFQGSLIGGAIGDALGGQFENIGNQDEDPALYVWGNVKTNNYEWQISDDTQLTLATCESIIENSGVFPEKIAQKFLEWFEKGKLSGLGSATVQAIHGLRDGGHWALVGQKGERSAGNGAAMRIAPLAFMGTQIDREVIRDICRITHHNEEAYAGALAVIEAIQILMDPGDMNETDWLNRVALALPDTNVRDRIVEIDRLSGKESIIGVAQTYGNSGYVVESIPLALFAVKKSLMVGFEEAMSSVIHAGGDTDTNASLFGQIAGARLGFENLPQSWVFRIQKMPEFPVLEKVIHEWKN